MQPVIGQDDFQRILLDLQARVVNAERLLGGFGLQAGNVVVGTNGSGAASVSFTHPYLEPPIVVVMGGNGEQVAGFHPVTSTTGFSVFCYSNTGAVLASVNVRLLWIAYPLTA